MESKNTGLTVEWGNPNDWAARAAIWAGTDAVLAVAAPYEADPPPSASSAHQAGYFLRQFASMWRLPTEAEAIAMGLSLDDVWYSHGVKRPQGKRRLILVRGVQWWEYRMSIGGRWEPARIGSPGTPNDPARVVRCLINEKNEEVEVARG